MPEGFEDVGISQSDFQTLRTLQHTIGTLIRKQREIKDQKETERRKINIVSKGNAEKATKFFGLGSGKEGLSLSLSLVFAASTFTRHLQPLPLQKKRINRKIYQVRLLLR